MQSTGTERSRGEKDAPVHEEVRKRYLAYALSTIVARALPDVRDGLKPVHRRILYAMHAMRLSESAKMRKSAAVVGEVIGKFHPHGDQAAYDALVRMAQDFSLRYPLIEGIGNFGSVDGDSPAAMRYTETRLSAFAGLLLKEIDQGTTDFRPTYDGVTEEPEILPAAMPNLLLNGATGIAVGMSCSFPPHNLREVISACRALLRDRTLSTRDLLKFMAGPDFPTGAEIVEHPDHLAEVYETGRGSVKVRGTYGVERVGRGRVNLVITSIPYSVNKARLIERIASLVKDRKLIHVLDVRDESTAEVRIVLELRGGDVDPASVMAFLYRHSDLQINYPINFIAITPQGVPDRLHPAKIIGYFLDFRYERTIRRLEHRRAYLEKRIHVLEGFETLFGDLDRALRIIRSARSRQEAAEGLRSAFTLDDEQVDAILEMRLYRLIGMEIGKVLEELSDKRKESGRIALDLGSPDRLWGIIDAELEDIAKKFGDVRRTVIVAEESAPALAYDPDEFVEHEDATVIVSRQGWIRRIKSEVDDPSALKFREGDGLLTCVRVNTGRTLAVFSSLGKVYVLRGLDVPATTGFGEPLGSLLSLADGEYPVAAIAPDPAEESSGRRPEPGIDRYEPDHKETQASQATIFDLDDEEPGAIAIPEPSMVQRGLLLTTGGKGFRFDYGMLREPTKRVGRRLVNLGEDERTASVVPEDRTMVCVAADTGKMLIFPVEQIPVLNGPGQGVRLIKLASGTSAAGIAVVDLHESVRINLKDGKELVLSADEIPKANRATQGKTVAAEGILGVERISGDGETRQ